jgi:hypothetical protein
VVDDNSPDGTQEVAKQLQGVYGDDKIVCHMCPESDREGLLLIGFETTSWQAWPWVRVTESTRRPHV